MSGMNGPKLPDPPGNRQGRIKSATLQGMRQSRIREGDNGAHADTKWPDWRHKENKVPDKTAGGY